MRGGVIVLLILYLFSGCGAERAVVPDDDRLLTLDIRLIRDTISNPLDELVKGVRFLRLEATPQSLIGEIIKMQFYNGEIFIISNRYSDSHYQELLRFDSEGNFLNAIGQRGRGLRYRIRF